MTNVHKLNQDNVLGGDDSDDLSPSEFDRRGAGMEIEDEQPAAQTKKSNLMPLVVGVLAALCIIGFFGWKIASPYFAQESANEEAFAPITAAPKPFEVEGAANAPAAGQNGTDQAFNLPPLPEAQNANSGVAAQQITTPTGLSSGAPDQAAAAQATVQPLPASRPVVGQPAVQPEKSGLPAGPSAEDIAQIHKRIDGIVIALDSLKETMAKLQQLQSKPSIAKAPVVAKPKPVVVAKKPAPVATGVTALSPTQNVLKLEKLDAAAPVLQLQAVLQDRAWFKTSTGETITVAPGEELKGVGIVQQIDAETGRVIFVNGMVFQ